MITRFDLSIAAIGALCVAQVALATNRYYDDSQAASPDGRFFLTARSPDNERPPDARPPFQSDFTFTLTDTHSGEVLWTRESTEWHPTAMWVHTDSSVVINDGGSSFVALDAISGRVSVKASLVTLLPKEDWTNGNVRQTSAGPMWQRDTHFGFFEHDGKTFFGCRTGWDRVFVLDFCGKTSITSPPKPIIESFDGSLRSNLLQVLEAAAANPKELTRRDLYCTPEVGDALDFAGRSGMKEAIPLIRALESIEPPTEPNAPTLGAAQLDPAKELRSYRLRQLARTALRRLGETPKPLACSYPLNRSAMQATARPELPGDRAARAAVLPQSVSPAELLHALGPPDAIVSFSGGGYPGPVEIWEFEIDDPSGVWILDAIVPDGLPLTWQRFPGDDIVCMSPSDREDRMMRQSRQRMTP